MPLTLRGVGYRYAGSSRTAISGLDLELSPGTVTGLVGANDSGKSTLCLVAAGLAPGTIGGELAGQVSIDELDTRTARPCELARRCGILFQEPLSQLSGTAPTVWEEVAFGPRNLALPLAEVIERVEASLDLLGIGDLAERDPTRLSGGQGQLVVLAGVLAMRAHYLVLDEPTSQLDPAGTSLVGDALQRVAAQTEAAILVAEHKTDLLAAIADRVLVMEDGTVGCLGEAGEILRDDRLEAMGVQPPSHLRLIRSAQAAGLGPDMVEALGAEGWR